MFFNKAEQIDELKKALRHEKFSAAEAVARSRDAVNEVKSLRTKNSELQKKLDELQPKFDRITIHTVDGLTDLWVKEGEGERISDSVRRQAGGHDVTLISVSTDDQDIVFLVSDFKSITVDYGVKKPSHGSYAWSSNSLAMPYQPPSAPASITYSSTSREGF